MRLNEQVYKMLDKEPFEVQELEGHKVELFIFNDYEDIMNEYISKGKFAVWSSIDGKNYRLAIEKGYYDELKELYTDVVNQAWLQFWDECEGISKNFSRHIVLPFTALAVIAFVIISFAFRKREDKVGSIITLAIAMVYVVTILILRKMSTRKMNESNGRALQTIKGNMGEEKFNDLLERQRKYIDAYYDMLAEKADQMDKEFEEQEKLSESDNNSDTEDVEIKENNDNK